ncbi:DUF1772 domain-containing protein [Paraflavitalea pollutisoli]|uniref:anthrone oxygenase family protein n=1 Tax=Paraflavitalea pollutisoli TaxID=3034143 RepID=UPI0023EC67A6|nr:anthrone oxygenase family protein [Paraflavitalea sp. H1-2-19X]
MPKAFENNPYNATITMKPTRMTMILLVAATLATSLAAGLFYAYTCSVNPGLSRLSDTAYLEAMQSINRAILNPVFFLSFIGAAILLPLAVYFTWRPHPTDTTWWFMAAAILYLIGVFGVTIAGNVPLNEALDRINIAASTPAELGQHRQAFEPAWTRYHNIRTIANLLSAIAAIVGCLFYSKG